MDKKMFLVRVVCGARACICVLACVLEDIGCENSQISPHEPTS